MTKAEMVNLTNRSLAGEMLRYEDLEHIYDDIIDDVNIQMNTRFPAFSEWADFVNEFNTNLAVNTPDCMPARFLDANNYTAIPDKYLRKLAKYGGAYKFYIEDEEGESVALEYFKGYQQTLFYMLRDYSEDVPAIFRCEDSGSIKNIGGAFV